MLDYLSVGYVVKPQGVRGEIKVEPLTDYMERFDELETLYLKGPDGYKPKRVVARRYSSRHIFLRLEGFEDRDSAEGLRGEYLWIPRHMARELPEDTFLIADIIGCIVYTEDGKELGKIDRVIETGSNDVYVTKGPMGEILIPGLKKVVSDIDINGRRIQVKASELGGLLPHED